MSDLKTKPTRASVKAFIDSVEDAKKREDARKLLKLMADITKEKPRMWGTSMIGFGTYHYRYGSGRQGDWPMTAFSPRAQNLTVYIMPGFKEYGDLLKKLGPHKKGSSCLYLKRLSDADMAVLKALIRKSFAYMKKKYG